MATYKLTYTILQQLIHVGHINNGMDCTSF